MEAFCYRLIFRGGQFVSVHSSNAEGDLLELCSDETISKYSFRKDGWWVICSQESHAPNQWKLKVEYKDKDHRYAHDKPSYCADHIIYGSGELFLCLTSNEKPISTFQYHDIRSTLFSAVGIHGLCHRDFAEPERFLFDWTDFADGEPFCLSWLFTDGDATFSLRKSNDSVDIVGFDDPALNGKRGYDLSVQVEQATWIVAVEICRRSDDGGAIRPPFSRLFVKDEAAAIEAIPKLHKYLAEHGCHAFSEFLYKRLP